MQPDRLGIASLLLAALLAGPTAASEPLFVTEQADVLLEIDDETRIEIGGLMGTLALRRGTEGELRYAARSLDKLRAPAPVELWLEERTLLLVPLEGREDDPVLVEIGLPPGLDVVIDTRDTRVTASNLDGSLEIRGERMKVQAGAVAGPITLELHGGTVTIKNAGDDVDLRGEDLEIDIQGVAGSLMLAVGKSSATVGYANEIEGDLQETVLAAQNVAGPVNLSLTKGKLDLEHSGEGGVIRLSEAELSLKVTRGALEVHTDSDMMFSEHSGELRVNGYGAAVRGIKLDGLLAIETDSADVILEGIDGATNIRGRELNVQLTDARGPVDISASYGTILIDGAKSEIKLRNEYGQVEIRDALQTIAVASVEDAIRMSGLQGAVQLEAQASEVDLAWAALPSETPSLVENDRGDIRLTLPSSANCQLQAEAPYGRVESSIEGVKVSEDGHSASGLLSRSRAAPQVKRSVLRVRAGGDIFLLSGHDQPPAQQQSAPRRPREPEERKSD